MCRKLFFLYFETDMYLLTPKYQSMRILLILCCVLTYFSVHASLTDSIASKDPVHSKMKSRRATRLAAIRQKRGLPMAKRTLKDRNGAIMRAAPIALGKNNFMHDNKALALDKEGWKRLQKIGYNSVRICWVDPWFWREHKESGKVTEIIPLLDKCVATATELGMNIIINYHDVGEYIKTNGFGSMEQFWSKIAPRYKDNDLVYYELNNEQTWNAEQYISDKFQRTMKRVYQKVRREAPQRQIILFSFNSLAYDCKRIVDSYSWIDWNYTTVGFHMYGAPNGNIKKEQEHFIKLIESYPVICTEWDYLGAPFDNLPGHDEFPYIKRFFGSKVSAEILEATGISWADWRGWNDATTNEYERICVPHAKKFEYWWGVYE